MKYCPFCGAELPSPSTLFCVECGESLDFDHPLQTDSEAPPLSRKTGRNSQTTGAFVRPKPNAKKKTRPSIEAAPQEQLFSQSGEEEPESTDDYDGYYDDVQPLDADAVRPGLDREVIKKIALLILGALLVIGLCVVLMNLL